jgi:5'-nucleotidase
MSEKPLIFLTNDDSYLSKGFRAAVNLAREFGRVIAIAPERVQSGMSQAITINQPLFLRQVECSEDVEIYAFSGTPVDCAKVAFDHFFAGRKVDLVLSGINHGSNSAINVLYSGTMGAAIEGSFYGCPSIGLSLTDHDLDADFTAAKHFSREIVAAVLAAGETNELPLCLNVNVPNLPQEQIRGIRTSRQCNGMWREEFFRHEDPRGKPYYWLTGYYDNYEPAATDTDEWALANGYVSVVPVQVDMTSYRHLEHLKKILG